MHLWSAAPQQVDERRVEGHDGIAHVHHLLLIVAISRSNVGKSEELRKSRKGKKRTTKLILRVSPQY